MLFVLVGRGLIPRSVGGGKLEQVLLRTLLVGRGCERALLPREAYADSLERRDVLVASGRLTDGVGEIELVELLDDGRLVRGARAACVGGRVWRVDGRRVARGCCGG